MTNSKWIMPSETDQHERMYMAFPPKGETFGRTDDEALAARVAWTEVAHATANFLPLVMVVDPADMETAKKMLSSDIEIIEAPLDDAWMRDIGPTFVKNREGTALAAIDWEFNGWGQQDWAVWEKDNQIAKVVAEHAGIETIKSDLVNEGGAIHVDGLGTVLLTETVQLERFRNPDWSRTQIEEEFVRTIGATNAIWFPRGLHRDSQRFGTRGHIDIIATLPNPETIMIHKQTAPLHPDFHLQEVYADIIAEAKTSAGGSWKTFEIPAPEKLRDEDGWLDYSYINHLVTNDAVIASSFDDPNDGLAVELLEEAYPGREVVTVDSRNIFAYGGGIHCITQQLPKI